MSTKEEKNGSVYHTDKDLKKDDLAEFKSWIRDVNQGIEDWTEYLKFKSKKEGKTYTGAIAWLRKNRPESPRSFHATGCESFSGVIQAMYDDATIDVRNEGLDKKVNDD